MKITKRAAKKRDGLSRYMRLGCPLTKSHSKWCYGMCKPANGLGFCGRIAPHGLEGRTQRAIRKYNEKNEKNETAKCSCGCECSSGC